MAHRIPVPVRTVTAWHGVDTDAIYDQVATEQDAALAEALSQPCACHGYPIFDCPGAAPEDSPGCSMCGGPVQCHHPDGTVCVACATLWAARALGGVFPS
jgi:hypothetical protein